jgi:hypothetical protein
MEKLDITIDGQKKKLEYETKFAKGIYLVDDTKSVEKNCRILSITFDPPPSDNVLQNKLTKIGSFAAVTMKAGNLYMQYLFFSSADPADFSELLKEAPNQSHDILRQGFNLSRKITLDNLDLLGRISSDSN